MANMTSFIISLILVSCIVTVFIVSMQDMSSKYGFTYDNSTMAQMARFNEINNLTADIQASSQTMSQQSGITDILGNMFSNGYKVLLLAGKSLDIFRTIIDQAFINLGLGGLGSVFKNTLIAILIIVVLMGIIIGAILKLKDGF